MIRQAISPRLEISSLGIGTGVSRGAKDSLLDEVEVEEDADRTTMEKPSLLLIHRRRACFVAPRSERRASISRVEGEREREEKEQKEEQGKDEGETERSSLFFDVEF